ncbi:MAG: Gfo/Idh/MocA family oxidoreductase [Roseobacter sp.]
MKNAALIGLGMVAKTHLDALASAETVNLIGVMGRDFSKTSKIAQETTRVLGYDVTPYADVSAVASDPRVDFVILATPPDARREIMLPLVSSGKPILLEKPIERTLKSAEQLVTMCENANVPLAVMFQHRAREASARLKEMVSQGKLGQITAAEVRIPWWRDQSYYESPGRGTYARDGGGVLLTQAIHTLDLALWILGPVSRVQAMLTTTRTHQLEAENWAGALFETTSGAVGTIMATTTAFPGSSETITLHGTQASAHLESGVLTIHHHDGTSKTLGETADTGGGADPMAFTHAWHQTVIEQFAASLDGRAQALSTGRDALAVHALIATMERSSHTGQWAEISLP